MSGINRRAALSVAIAVCALLAGCGGGGGDAYALRIDPPASLTTTQNFVFLRGEGFLPAGSRCSGGCEGLLPPPVFGDLGPHTLRWSNADSGGSGVLNLIWICNCGGSAPSWLANVPLVAGPNRITVTETDTQQTQQATITITRS